MTRKEVLDEVNLSTDSSGFGSFPDMAQHTVSLLINRIYDDFEEETEAKEVKKRSWQYAGCD